MESPFLKAHLAKALHTFNLEIDFTLEPGQTLGILGASGSGKSMTLRILAGLVKPDRGYIALGGHVLLDTAIKTDLRPQERRMGYVFQHYALFPHLTVAENIAYGIPRQLDKTARQNRIGDLLTVIRLTKFADRYPAELSGGQQQRVALARALAADPGLLLLDEPFSAVDSELRGELEALVSRFRELHRIPYILVTHNLEEAYRLCDRLMIIDHGHILQQGDKNELLRKPQSVEVARKVGAKNLWAGDVVRRDGPGGAVYIPSLKKELYLEALPESTSVWVGIRPVEAVLLSGPEPGLPNMFPIHLAQQIRGLQSHTLFVVPLQPDPVSDASEAPEAPSALALQGIPQMPGMQNISHISDIPDILEIEVPGHRLPAGPPHLFLPPDKLFAIKR